MKKKSKEPINYSLTVYRFKNFKTILSADPWNLLETINADTYCILNLFRAILTHEVGECILRYVSGIFEWYDLDYLLPQIYYKGSSWRNENTSVLVRF